MGFFSKFESLCKEKGITPTHAARDIGITQQAVSMWKKRGSIPKYETLKKIAVYFGVEVEDLIYDDDNYERKDFLNKLADDTSRLLGKTEDESRQFALEFVLDTLPYETLGIAERNAKMDIIKDFEGISDEILEMLLLDGYRSLTRFGKIKVINYLSDIVKIYMRQKESPQAKKE